MLYTKSLTVRHIIFLKMYLFILTGIPLIYSLVQEVQDAFSTGEPVLTGFSFLHPENLPQTIPELREYGQVTI